MYQENEATIKLPKSHLSVVDDVLIKQSSQGDTIGRHPLSAIKYVSVIKETDKTAIVIMTLCAILAVLAKFFIPSSLWSWLVFFFFAFITLIPIFGLQKFQLKIEFVDDELLYEILDNPGEAKSFAISLKDLIEAYRTS